MTQKVLIDVRTPPLDNAMQCNAMQCNAMSDQKHIFSRMASDYRKYTEHFKLHFANHTLQTTRNIVHTALFSLNKESTLYWAQYNLPYKKLLCHGLRS